MRERIEHWPLDDVLARWDELIAGHRHFSFFWLPSEASAVLYGLPTPPGQSMTDTCYTKIYDVAGDDVPDDATPDRRVDRSYRIYPAEFAPNFHELEYFVPLERGREAVEAMRELMLASQPLAVFPMEVRTSAADDAYLSSNYGRADDRHLGLRRSRAPRTGRTSATSTACSASSARACTGASSTS